MTDIKNDWGFVVRNFEDQETQQFLRGILNQDSCVPFLGAGFTRGEKARHKAVPGGGEWMDLMRQQIRKSPVTEKPSDDELNKFSFQEISDIYFRGKIVSLETIKSDVNSYFTNVKIEDESKVNFLSVDWPYIYTLNIDDGIERTIDGIKVLPYREFSRFDKRRYVYKLHGDAEDVMTAASHEELRVIFGKADYINSLNGNKYLISSLVNDFCEKNIIFIGCSLSDELDIAYALANPEFTDKDINTSRIFITSEPLNSYADKMKLKSYGITDVIITNYSNFYDFVSSVSQSKEHRLTAIEAFQYISNAESFTGKNFASYLLQSGWNQEKNPGVVSVRRTIEKNILDKINDPLIVIWGRRFSGKSTLLLRVIEKIRTRKRYLVHSKNSMSVRAFNDIFKIKDALIAIDSGAIHYNQLKSISQKIDSLRENNTTIILAVSKADLNAFGSDFEDEAIQLESRLIGNEIHGINKLLDTQGLQRWNGRDSILDNIFVLAKSPIIRQILNIQSRLEDRIISICSEGSAGQNITEPSKLDFSILFYLVSREKIFSFVHRDLIRNYGLAYLLNTHLDKFSKKWAPFIEYEKTDTISSRAEKSAYVTVCNSYAWIQLAVSIFSEKLGVKKTASYIAELYQCVSSIDQGAYKIIMFDNLNAIYSPKMQTNRDWCKKMITSVYEELVTYCAQDPDYWLQRAKGIYYLSDKEDEIRIAIEYCKKSIVERSIKTGINSKLTKANLLGKLCMITNYIYDEDISEAIQAYADAINDRDSNSLYIDGLLKKNRAGFGYMKKVCEKAAEKMALLPKKADINLIQHYINNA
ncbi:TPA: SIR2 family protein [Klebsiella michiganensis]|nr:SIR2 family protein [Klebsiella michiganensis]